MRRAAENRTIPRAQRIKWQKAWGNWRDRVAACHNIAPNDPKYLVVSNGKEPAMFATFRSALPRVLGAAALTAAVALPLTVPTQAHAWWRPGFGVYLPPIVVAPAPAYYPPPPVVYAPPVVVAGGPIWIGPHWYHGYWMHGYWRR
jgi:hypothetical protein